MSARSEEERERARLERERRRAAERGEPLPPVPSAPATEKSAPPRPESAQPQTVPRPGAAPPPMPPDWNGHAETVQFEPPPPPPQKVPHGHVARNAVIFAGAVVLIGALWFWLSVFQPFAGDGKGTGKVNVTVPRGSNVSAIGKLLAAKQIVPSAKKFGWRAKWSGKSDQLKAGRYVLGSGMSYGAAIDQLAKGPNAGTVTVVIPEGESRYETAQIVSSDGLDGDYMAATKSSPLLSPEKYGAPAGTDSLEGFLFPATYVMAAGANVKKLVPQQLTAFKQNIAEVNMRYARKKNLTVFDVVTIASLIEREVSKPSERKLVAAVIYNRLKQGIQLGIDATSRFETRNWTEPLTNATLEKDTPYNTRINKGLPPGPIGNPGLASLQAAAHPANSSYLYYVANPCKPGTHTFTKTYAQFQAAADRYNQARAAAGDKQPSGC